MWRHRSIALASAFCTRSSAACWSPVSAWAARSSATVRSATNRVNSASARASTRTSSRTYDAAATGYLARMAWAAVPSPIGPLGVAADDAGIRALHFTGPGGRLGEHPLLVTAAGPLDEDFAGDRSGLDLRPADPRGTPLER